MMRKLCFILLISLACLSLYAKEQPTILKGRVVEADGRPVMYASVSLVADMKNVAGTLTDTTGLFLLKGQFDGKYEFKVSSIGYEDIVQVFNLHKGETLDLGNIVVKQNDVLLEGVVVVGEAASKNVTLEKTRINLASNMSTTTGSVIDALRGSSAVSVDGNGQVSIRGNSNVLILVDGIPTTLDGLGGIPAANVQSIDIVTSPDVKYDSEGTGGIINIVSKKQMSNAFTAMASANYGFNNLFNANLAMSYNTGRWGLRMNYNGRYEKDRIESELHRNILPISTILDQLIDANKKTTGQNVGVNISYKVTKKDVLALDFKAGFPRMNNLQTMHNHYVIDGAASDKVRLTDITFNREMYEGALNYKHIFDPGKREFSTMLSLSAINGHRPSYYYEDDFMTQYSESGGHPRIAAFQLDYMTTLGKGKLETGVKMTYRKNNIDHKMYERDETDSWLLSLPLSNDLKHREYIPAAYVMFSSKLSNKLSYKTGVRFEYSHVSLLGEKDNLNETSDCYFIAPNVMLNYRVSEPWSLSLGLSRRISRPTYPQLNPYINLIDNKTYETGNVRLKPEKVNKIDFGYTFAGSKLRISGNAYLNYTQDYINQIAYLNQDILVTSYINSDMDLKAGIEHNLKWNTSQWMGIDVSANLFYSKSHGDRQEVSFTNSGWTFNGSTSLNFYPIKGMTIQAQYFLTTPQYFQQFTSKTVHYCNIGIRQQLLDKSLTLSALVTDVFNTRRWDITTDNPIYSLINTSKNRSRILWLGISWNFHSHKPVGGQKKQEEDRSIIRLGD
ncbi:MAG: TonB-dependent receptor [Muribaculaceae bacterium]|nr:TonB-dependent receptor [Muribaculaceae bacterium]